MYSHAPTTALQRPFPRLPDRADSTIQAPLDRGRGLWGDATPLIYQSCLQRTRPGTRFSGVVPPLRDAGGQGTPTAGDEPFELFR